MDFLRGSDSISTSPIHDHFARDNSLPQLPAHIIKTSNGALHCHRFINTIGVREKALNCSVWMLEW